MVGAQGLALPSVCWVSGEMFPSSLRICTQVQSPTLLKALRTFTPAHRQTHNGNQQPFAHLGMHRQAVTVHPCGQRCPHQQTSMCGLCHRHPALPRHLTSQREVHSFLLLVFPVTYFRAKAVKIRIYSFFVPYTLVCLQVPPFILKKDPVPLPASYVY